jgi:hypothetical protein
VPPVVPLTSPLPFGGFFCGSNPPLVSLRVLPSGGWPVKVSAEFQQRTKRRSQTLSHWSMSALLEPKGRVVPFLQLFTQAKHGSYMLSLLHLLLDFDFLQGPPSENPLRESARRPVVSRVSRRSNSWYRSYSISSQAKDHRHSYYATAKAPLTRRTKSADCQVYGDRSRNGKIVR